MITKARTCVHIRKVEFLLRIIIIIIITLLLLLLKALQLQGIFDPLNEYFPLGPVSDAVLPVCYFHICYVTFYIILPPIFRSS